MLNPNKILKDDLPLIVLSTLSSGFIAMWIRWRTKASYSHIMTMLWPEEFVSQGNTFSTVPISRYMIERSRLKFWKIKDLTGDETYLIYKRINTRLKLPWWKRLYNFPGIFGQMTGLKRINSIFGFPYCSQQVNRDVLDDIIEGVPDNPSPKDLNEFFKEHPRMEVYGRWAAD